MSAIGIALGLGLGGVALALILNRRSTASAYSADSLPAPSDDRELLTSRVWTPQTPEDVMDLLRTACECVDAAPLLEEESIVVCVWRAHWYHVDYPERALAGDHPSVQEALDAARGAVKAALDGQCDRLPDLLPMDTDEPDELDGISPLPIPMPPPLGSTAAPKPEPPSLGSTAAPIRVDIAALTRETPTPGYFYQVREGDLFLVDDGIVAHALHQAVFDAALAKGWSNVRAHARAAAIAADAKARIAYLSIIQHGAWNDAMYGTWGYGKEAHPAGHGRAIRLIPRHDRVYDRLANGQAPIRTLDRGTPHDKCTGVATGAGDAFELLWLPPLRSDALLDANRSRQVIAEGLVWPGGSSKYDPPPAVQELGISNAPSGPWGCKEFAA